MRHFAPDTPAGNRAKCRTGIAKEKKIADQATFEALPEEERCKICMGYIERERTGTGHGAFGAYRRNNVRVQNRS